MTEQQTEDRVNQVRTPKSFFVKERDQFYSVWQLAYWRELFQNAVDAGARAIDIEVSDADSRGAFGKKSESPEVVRLVFSDDGHGMSEKVLDDVYFRIGASTKDTDETSVGGFGRARLMTCFSQDRYSIETLDRVVEGDGGSYLNMARGEAAASLARWAARLEEAGAQGDDAAVKAAARVRSDAERIAAGPRVLTGCRVEVDAAKTRRVDAERMLSYLNDYLDMSEIKVSVRVNGELKTPKKTKMESRRDLVATLTEDQVETAWKENPQVGIKKREDGRYDVVFGRLMVVRNKEKEKAASGGRVMVRVSGAWMFSMEAAGLGQEIVVELAPNIARGVLTSNRDGLKAPFRTAMDDLLSLLATDATMALKKDEETNFHVVRGGLGEKRAGTRKKGGVDAYSDVDRVLHSNVKHVATGRRRADGGYDSYVTLSDDEVVRRREDGYDDVLLTPDQVRLIEVSNERRSLASDRAIYFGDEEYYWKEFLAGKITGLETKPIIEMLDELRASPSFEDSFLRHIAYDPDARDFYDVLKERGHRAAMVRGSGRILGYVASEISFRRRLAVQEERALNRDRFASMYDIPILRENLTVPAEEFSAEEAAARRAKLKTAVRRHDPRHWDEQSGKGMMPRKVLAAWTIAIDACAKILFEDFPNAKGFEYSCGWLFAHPSREWDSLWGDRRWKGAAAAAKPEVDGENKNIAFLLNPLDANEDFKARYKPSSADDRNEIINLAAHEMAHAMVDRHNDDFVRVRELFASRLTDSARREIHREMLAAFKVIDDLYARGRTRIAALDDQSGERPSERLMRGLPESVARAAVVRHAGGATYDNDVIASEEEALRAAARLAEEEEEPSEGRGFGM